MKQIRIQTETKHKLDLLKHPGQTYDGIIRELLQSYFDLKSVDKYIGETIQNTHNIG